MMNNSTVPAPTVATYDPNTPTLLSLTAAAEQFFAGKLRAQPGKMVRLSTKASGCTGYAYVLDLVDAPAPGDELVQASPALAIAVSPDAVPLVRGTEIDLVTEGVNEVVKFHNPNVVAECGCGESFSVSAD